MFANAVHAIANDVNNDAWNSFHILDDVVDAATMYLMSSLPGKTIAETFHELFEFEYEGLPPTPRPRAMPKTRHISRSSPLYWRCPAFTEHEYAKAARITRPAKAFAARVAAAGTPLLPITEGGVHFVDGFVTATYIVPRKEAKVVSRTVPKTRRMSRSSPLYWRCPAFTEHEYAKAARITRPAKAFAARVAAAGTPLLPITEGGVHFVDGFVTATYIVPRKEADLVSCGSAEQLEADLLGVQDMDWEPTPNNYDMDESAKSLDECMDWFVSDNNDNNFDDEEQVAVTPVVLLPVVEKKGHASSNVTVLSSSRVAYQEPIRLRRSARLAATMRLKSDKSKSALFLGSIIVNGQRRSARLLKTVG